MQQIRYERIVYYVPWLNWKGQWIYLKFSKNTYNFNINFTINHQKNNKFIDNLYIQIGQNVHLYWGKYYLNKQRKPVCCKLSHICPSKVFKRWFISICNMNALFSFDLFIVFSGVASIEATTTKIRRFFF
jgi:hypothetical protein